MQWSHNMVHSHFTLCLRVHDYLKWLSQHPWYGRRMRVKGPYHYKVMALGSCVKWPKATREFTWTNSRLDTKQSKLDEVSTNIVRKSWSAHASLRCCLHYWQWSCPISENISNGHISMGPSNKCIERSFMPNMRCNPNVDQEKWPCTRN